MSKTSRKAAAVTAATAALIGLGALAAPSASAAVPGSTVSWSGLSCEVYSDPFERGHAACFGQSNVNWRVKVKCTLGGTYYGRVRNNWWESVDSGFGGASIYTFSSASSSCFWSVSDISIVAA